MKAYKDDPASHATIVVVIFQRENVGVGELLQYNSPDIFW